MKLFLLATVSLGAVLAQEYEPLVYLTQWSPLFRLGGFGPGGRRLFRLGGFGPGGRRQHSPGHPGVFGGGPGFGKPRFRNQGFNIGGRGGLGGGASAVNANTATQNLNVGFDGLSDGASSANAASKNFNLQVVPSHYKCYIPYCGKEVAYQEYEILVSL